MALKKRIVAAIIVKDGWAVQSLGFNRYLPVGRPDILAETLDRWLVDEIILLDISASKQGKSIDPQLVERVADRIATPLTVGGGISTVEHVRQIIAGGADKVAINTEAYRRIEFLGEAAAIFGRQCIVGSIDVERTDGGDCILYNKACHIEEDVKCDPAGWARRLEDAGAGEILLNSVARDGSKSGFDMDIIEMIGPHIDVPLIVLGGAGRSIDFQAVLNLPTVAAAGAANMWTFTEHSVAQVKSYLADIDQRVRHDGELDYRGRPISGGKGRLGQSEHDLDRMTERPMP